MKNPVILLHGWAGSFEHTWQRSGLVQLLQDSGRHVLPYDLPGHGSSSKSHVPNDYVNLHGTLLQFLAQHGVVDAVGFSLGAVTLLRALVASPKNFGRVVLAGIGDGVFQAHDPSRSERILSGVEGRADPGDVVARIFGKIGNENGNDPQALAAVLRRPREEAMTEVDLVNIQNNVLIALGEKDFSAPADRLAAALPHAQLVSLKGIDHFRTPDAFEFLESALNFLDA